MWIPDTLTKCVCFLGIQHEGRFAYQGTGFFVSLSSERCPGALHFYLVTAKHCVEGIDVSVRVNTKDGKATDPVPVEGTWHFHEDSTIDLAVAPCSLPKEFDIAVVPGAMFARHDLELENGSRLQPGTDLFLTGLFTGHPGSHRNLPVVRKGILSALAEEPIYDPDRDEYYVAHLAEVRSIAGLSGSPVFAFFQYVGIPEDNTKPLTLQSKIYLLGVLRDYWTKRSTGREPLNVGLAGVTPAEKLSGLLASPRLVASRREAEQEWLRRGH